MSATDDAHDRMARFFERGDFGVLIGVGALIQAKISEDAVVAIDLGRAQLFAIDRNDALALLAGGLGNQLLEPRAQIGDSGRSNERDFVAAKIRGGAQDHAEHHSWIFFDRNGGGAGIHHLFRAVQEFPGVHAHGRGRNHPEI